MWQLTISVNHSSKETHYYMYLHSLPSTGRYNYTVLWYTFIAFTDVDKALLPHKDDDGSIATQLIKGNIGIGDLE